MKKIAVFASGNGSNFQVIAEQFPVEFVFSDHRDAYVLERAVNLVLFQEFDKGCFVVCLVVKLLEFKSIG